MAFNKPKIKINVNWLLFVAAIGLGVGAVYLSNAMLNNRMHELEESTKKGQEMVRVVVAKQDLEKGELLTSEVMAVRQIPKEYVHHTTVLPNQFEDFTNQRLSIPIKRGEALLAAHLEGNGSNVFSSTLKKGSRALTFEVDAVNSISGMLRPGDRIDLIYSSRVAGGGEKEETKPLLSNVTVLATDQTLSKRDDGTGKERTFSTITLEVNPYDAGRIIVAKSAGRLTALLRNPDDDAANTTVALTADQLYGAAGQRGDARMIEYLVGGGGGIAELQLNRLLPGLDAKLSKPDTAR